MNRKITLLMLMLTVIALYGVPSASAYGGYLNAFNQQYNTSGTKLDSCGVCHVAPGGGGAVNPYGKAFADTGNSFAAIESLDSDGDGYTNINEINNLTFPGNPGNKPGSSPATLAAVSELELEDDGIESYEGQIGSDSVLYGFKLSLEDFGETFTFNEAEKISKKINHAKLRIAEAKGAWKKNNDKAAENALEHYRAKMGEVDTLVSEFKGTDSGLANAQQMIAKHETVLKNLLERHPGNKGLERAYSNSQELKVKFEEKIKRKEARKEGEVNIKAKIIGNNTSVAIELNFKSESTDNFTIAQEIHDKFQLSVENINGLLMIENIDKGELKTELEAEANIEKGFTIVKAEYKFPLLDTTERTGIISGIHDKLSELTAAEILRVLEIKDKTERKELQEAKKEEKREDKEVKKEVKGAKKEEKGENKEKRKGEKATRNED